MFQNDSREHESNFYIASTCKFILWKQLVLRRTEQRRWKIVVHEAKACGALAPSVQAEEGLIVLWAQGRSSVCFRAHVNSSFVFLELQMSVCGASFSLMWAGWPVQQVQVPAGEIIGSYPQEATACTTMHHCWAVVDTVCRFKYVMIGCLNGTNYFSDTTQLCVVSHSPHIEYCVVVYFAGRYSALLFSLFFRRTRLKLSCLPLPCSFTLY